MSGKKWEIKLRYDDEWWRQIGKSASAFNSQIPPSNRSHALFHQLSLRRPRFLRTSFESASATEEWTKKKRKKNSIQFFFRLHLISTSLWRPFFPRWDGLKNIMRLFLYGDLIRRIKCLASYSNCYYYCDCEWRAYWPGHHGVAHTSKQSKWKANLRENAFCIAQKIITDCFFVLFDSTLIKCRYDGQDKNVTTAECGAAAMRWCINCDALSGNPHICLSNGVNVLQTTWNIRVELEIFVEALDAIEVSGAAVSLSLSLSLCRSPFCDQQHANLVVQHDTHLQREYFVTRARHQIICFFPIWTTLIIECVCWLLANERMAHAANNAKWTRTMKTFRLISRNFVINSCCYASHTFTCAKKIFRRESVAGSVLSECRRYDERIFWFVRSFRGQK